MRRRAETGGQLVLNERGKDEEGVWRLSDTVTDANEQFYSFIPCMLCFTFWINTQVSI